MAYRLFYQDLCINGIWSNGHGEVIPDTSYLFEEMFPDMTVRIERIGAFDRIMRQVEEGDFNPEHKYRIRPLDNEVDGHPWVVSTRQRAWINNRISLVIIKPKEP